MLARTRARMPTKCSDAPLNCKDDWANRCTDICQQRSYIVDQMFPVQQCLGKLSITALYRRIFGINRTYATWIYSVAAAQIVTSLIMLFVQCFQCSKCASLVPANQDPNRVHRIDI